MLYSSGEPVLLKELRPGKIAKRWKKKQEIRKDKKRRHRNPEVGSGGWNQGFKYSRKGKRRYHT
jgi:hypothetical protein